MRHVDNISLYPNDTYVSIRQHACENLPRRERDWVQPPGAPARGPGGVLPCCYLFSDQQHMLGSNVTLWRLQLALSSPQSHPFVQTLKCLCFHQDRYLRCENRPANRPASRETGLEMPCCPANDLLWVQITQSYPNRLRFSSLPCPQSPCHALIFPVFKEGFF